MSDFAALRVMMVDTQVRPSDVTKFPIIAAMLDIPREDYVPAALRDTAYMGANVDLGAGRVVLDARVFAKMLDALDIQPHERVLDLGCGLGYSTAVIARLAGQVVGVEENADMAAAAGTVLAQHGAQNAAVVTAPLTVGTAGPFDAIIIQGGVEQIPAAILGSLRDGGRIAAVFMQGPLGIAKIGLKSESGISWRFSFNATLPVLAGFQSAKAFAL